MSSTRIAVAAIDPANTMRFPSSLLRQLWQQTLHPLKPQLANRHGIHLSGIQILHHSNPFRDRNFERIIYELGFGPPLHRHLRFLISDSPITRLPPRPAEQLLIAVELKEGDTRWDPHPLDPGITRITCSFQELENILPDIVLDFSYANSFVVNSIIQNYLKSGITSDSFFASKASFLGLTEKLPYYSFSYHLRKGRPFGTIKHVEGFIACWDEFLAGIVDRIPDHPSVLVRTATKLPGYRDQIARNALRSAILQLPSGAHILYLQRRATVTRVSAKFHNVMKSAHDSFDIRGAGRNPFGFYLNGRLPHAAEIVVREGAAHIFRLHVGAKQ